MSKRGFTLIELMVVVAIMAILAVAGLAVFSNARANAKDSRMKNNVKAYQQAFEQKFDAEAEYYTEPVASDFDNNNFPENVTATCTYVGVDCVNYCIVSDELNTATGNCTDDCTTWNPDGDGTHFCAAGVQ